MAKTHTHYDNLKVARAAPPEVIRAAYKALSQKYHPDKNPGDETAARIMAIVNTAYGILSEPARRKEHDEWIAAEEWEIDWLDSTRAEDGHKARDAHGWAPREVDAQAPYRRMRDPKWWFGLSACFAAGCAAALLVAGQLHALPPSGSGSVSESGASHAVNAAPATPVPLDPAADGWAVSKAHAPQGPAQPPPNIRTLGVTQLIVPAGAPDCGFELHSLVAPNGERWPSASGYVDGYQVANQGEEMQIQIDNAKNGSAVFVKLYDLDRRANVRHAYVLARGLLSIDGLAAGKYEVRYQNVDPGSSKADCAARTQPTRQAAAPP
ncbi:J domain-containing protein [Massilia psychrophila]|uniref:J domain-containing protein n=1 Tax=Massilia psychrophila TaxID=1603353 RepID=A0A2G8SWI5_9BURK|nr:J domain-containing protein [Massilia psychrophila]PIL38149.1 hypothetical protein CR103_19630 [Massilia psychrophila]GGE86055.1 molecular chaperone DnaJ [Massilia psychrophila]